MRPQNWKTRSTRAPDSQCADIQIEELRSYSLSKFIELNGSIPCQHQTWHMERRDVVACDSDSESCPSRGLKRQRSKLDVTELSDSDAQSAQAPAVVRPKIQKTSKSIDPATVRARISFLVGTTCTCARQRKKSNMSCHRQFRGDIDHLSNLRVDLHKLAIADMDAKAA